MNFLEQLVAEWYAFNGCFVQTNLKFGKREAGGYEGEIDVIAFHPSTKIITHVETSGDADSWEERRQRFAKKFNTAQKYYSELFQFDYNKVEKVAIVGYGSKCPAGVLFDKNVTIKTVPEFIAEITAVLGQQDVTKRAVPEHWPIIRALQLSACCGLRATSTTSEENST